MALQDLLPRKVSQNIFAPIGDTPPTPDLSMNGPVPVLPPIVAPAVTVDPRMSSLAADPLERRKSELNADLYKRSNPIAPTTTLGKIGHVAANVGNVLGDIFAPDVMASIPGTQLYNERIRNRDQDELAKVSQEQTAEGQRKQEAALTDYTEQRPEIEQGKIAQKLTSTLGKVGLVPVRDAQGNLTGETVNDPNSPAAESRQIHDDTEKSRQDYLAAQAEVDRTKNDPNSPAYKLAVTRANIARQNAGAAITRAQAYYGNYLEHAFNKDLQGNVLPGAPQIRDNSGNVTTVGSTNATQAVKANANAGQFNDVHGALDSIESTADNLTKAGGKLNDPQVVAALQGNHGTISQWISSVNKANLTPEQRDYVLSNIALHENIQGLRKSAGGGATDSQVSNLLNMAPSGATPDIDYLKRQTSQIRQTAERLGKGVATASGGLTGRGEQPPSNAPAEHYERVNGKLVKVTK